MQQQETQNNSSTEMFNIPAKEDKAAPAAEQAPAKKSVEELKKEGPIYLGGKKFNNVEELAIYTQKLEMEKSVQAEAAPAASKRAAQAVEKPISELIFEDPEKALELHEQRVIQKLKAEENRAKSEQAFWTDFYSKNNDLSADDDIVQFVVQKHMGELGHLHPDQASEKIAEYSRKALSRFRGAQETTKALPSGQAKAGPSNTQSAPAVTESRPATVDFVSQLKKIQRRKK